MHADKALATQWAEVIAEHYAPGQKKDMVRAFMGKRNAEFRGGTFELVYTYEQGPAIGEHLLVVKPRP